jgi:hypothetical protein
VTAPLEDDDAPKKPTRAKVIRTAVAVTVALACAGAFAWVRWGMEKSGLGEPCAYKVNCGSDAPTCLKQTAEEDGVCSRPCDPGVDCAPGIACVKVELDERDDRGNPLEGGYCFPQALLDARKKKPAVEAGVARDSYVDVPETPGQLEGEVEIQTERGKAAPQVTTYLVKGTLIRPAANAKKRTVADASTMRIYFVDDDKKTFGAAALEGAGSIDGVKVEKTVAKDAIAGTPCEIWRIEEPKVTREVCVIHGGAFVDPGARGAATWQRELAVRTAFPLRVIERDASGAERSRMTVTRLDLHPVDAALFAIPRAYRNVAAK